MYGSRLITSTGNQRIRSVASLTRRSARLKHRAFIAEGPANVREALKLSLRQLTRAEEPCVLGLYATEAALENYPDVLLLSQELGRHTMERFLVTEEVAGVMGAAVTSQGLLAVCRFLEAETDRVVARACSPGQILVACGIQDPGNAGTMIRIADAAGAAGVFFTEHEQEIASVDIYNPKVVRSSAGSLFHIPVTTGVGSRRLLENVKRNGFRIYAMDAHASRTINDIPIPDVARHKIAWLLGNESQGLSGRQKEDADYSVSIPIYGSAESLNVAAATALCLYETAFKQRGERLCGEAEANMTER